MQKFLVTLRSNVVLPGLLLACFTTGELVIAQLPPGGMAERYLSQAERELDSGDSAAALETLETLDQILALQAGQGLGLPEVFWFRRARAAYDAGHPELALESLVRYFKYPWQSGEDYPAALELYNEAELAKAEAQRLAVKAEVLAAPAEALTPEMVLIPAGSFRMGCVSGQDCWDHVLPVHEVTILEPFEVSKYEVTFAEWDACAVRGGCGGYRPDDHGWGRSTRPVIDVSWADAQAYVSWLSSQTGEHYRLLTEAEWEYVARAGTETDYGLGDNDGSNLPTWTRGRSMGRNYVPTAPVGSFPANAFGVHDLHGNVFEWVEDCRNDSYAGAPTDGSAWLSGDCDWRVLRGFPRSMHGRYRFRSGDRYYRYYESVIGFRVARTLSP